MISDKVTVTWCVNHARREQLLINSLYLGIILDRKGIISMRSFQDFYEQKPLWLPYCARKARLALTWKYWSLHRLLDWFPHILCPHWSSASPTQKNRPSVAIPQPANESFVKVCITSIYRNTTIFFLEFWLFFYFAEWQRRARREFVNGATKEFVLKWSFSNFISARQCWKLGLLINNSTNWSKGDKEMHPIIGLLNEFLTKPYRFSDGLQSVTTVLLGK